ncbi:hypothetical protein EAF04_002998 [Stromatinia cepivora]|nr:hypothetical protein EAF04_002998 [Stromatinia cepivora]
MHLFSILTLASTAATLAIAMPAPVSNDIEKRQSQFCTTIGFSNPYCSTGCYKYRFCSKWMRSSTWWNKYHYDPSL